MSTQDDTTLNQATAFEQWEVVELASSAGEDATPAVDAEAELRARACPRRLQHPRAGWS